MPLPTTNIIALHKLEAQARELQRKLDHIKSRWESLNLTIRTESFQAWKEHCERHEIDPHYTFNDILS